MAKTIYLSESERALKEFVNQNIAIFANGDTDWLNVRDYCIQRCYEYNLAHGEKSPTTTACRCNGVQNTYYSKKNIGKKTFK